MLNLSCLGQKGARYVLMESLILLQKVKDLQKFTRYHKITPEFIDLHLNDSYRGLTDERTLIYTVMHVYKGIYETLANRLNNSLIWHPQQLVTMTSWLRGKENLESDPRNLRNKICHVAGIPQAFRYNEENDLFNRIFDAKDFIEKGIQKLEPLEKDIVSFVAYLEDNIDSCPLIEPPAPDAGADDALRIFDELKENKDEDKHIDAMELSDKEAELSKRYEDLTSQTSEVESGDLNMLQQEAIKVAQKLRHDSKMVRKQSQEVYREKIALAQRVKQEREEADQAAFEAWGNPSFDWNPSDNSGGEGFCPVPINESQ